MCICIRIGKNRANLGRAFYTAATEGRSKVVSMKGQWKVSSTKGLAKVGSMKGRWKVGT
jgi:hypothetical protein